MFSVPYKTNFNFSVTFMLSPIAFSLVTRIFSFFHSVFLFSSKKKKKKHSNLDCRLQMLSIWSSLKFHRLINSNTLTNSPLKPKEFLPVTTTDEILYSCCRSNSSHGSLLKLVAAQHPQFSTSLLLLPSTARSACQSRD